MIYTRFYKSYALRALTFLRSEPIFRIDAGGSSGPLGTQVRQHARPRVAEMAQHRKGPVIMSQGCTKERQQALVLKGFFCWQAGAR